MIAAGVYCGQLDKENNYKLPEIRETNCLGRWDKNFKICKRCWFYKRHLSSNTYHRKKLYRLSINSITKSGCSRYTRVLKRLEKYPHMYSYVLHAITAAASRAAVGAAAIATPTHERLQLVYENSHSALLAASDESHYNNVFILANASSSSRPVISYTYSSSTLAATTGNLNDSSLTDPSLAFISSSVSTLPALTYAGNGSASSAPLNEAAVNVSMTSTGDWSHFYDLILSWQGVCLIAVFCAFIVITIIGNTLVILAVITTRRLKTVTNCFVMSLAVADLLVGIFVMPPAVAVHLIGSWQLGWVLCDIWISLDVLLCTASILSLCAISVDRYLAVTQPLTYSRKRRSKRLALIMILMVWVLALAITCPPILGWYEPGRRDLNECRYNQNEGYVIFSAMGSFFIPMAVMIYVYARISCVIANRHDNMTDISVHNKKFKRYTAADIDNELEPDLSEFDLGSTQKKQQAPRTLSNQTLAKDLQEIMASDNKIATTMQCHSLLVSPTSKNGCYEMKRPASLKRCNTASSVTITTTSTTSTATVTNQQQQQEQQQQPHQYQQHENPNKELRTHGVRHQHCLGGVTSPDSNLTPDSIVMESGASILRTHTSQLRSQQHPHPHLHTHHYPTKSLSNRISSLKKETKTTQTLSIVVGGFIACWLPFFINYLITPFLDEDQVSSTLAKVLTWLGWFNSAINPFIYAFYSVDFRAAFWRLTCKRFFSSSSKPQFPVNTMSIRR